jgi:hypothetical protein
MPLKTSKGFEFMTTRRLSLIKHITNAKNYSENALAEVFRVVRFSGGSNSLANKFIQVKAQDAQSDAAGTLPRAQRPMIERGTLNHMQNRKKTQLLTSGEKVAARVGIYLPTPGYQKAKAKASQALIFFYLMVVLFGYFFPTVQSYFIPENKLLAFFNFSTSNAEWLLPNPVLDAETCFKLADNYQSLLKQMLDIRC